MCTAAPLRYKSVLHIMDGIRAVYHSGPFAWNTDFMWEAKTLLFGTDPVAVDRVELEFVEKKRREVGVPSLWDRNPANLGTQRHAEDGDEEPVLSRAGAHQGGVGAGARTYELNEIDHRRVRVASRMLHEPVNPIPSTPILSPWEWVGRRRSHRPYSSLET